MRKHGAVLAVVCLALATVVSAVSALNVAIPSLARSTQATQTELSWIIDAYAVTFAALLLPCGALGDRVGRKKVLLLGLAVFGTAGFAAMFTDSVPTLIALRAVLGAGAALVMPATLSTITATFPPQERVKGVAVWTGVAGASAVLGLLASGLLLEQWPWQSVFGLNFTMALLAMIGVAAVVPDSRRAGHVGMDLVGSVLSIGGIGTIVYGLIEAPTNGWTSGSTMGALGAGVVLVGLFFTWESTTRDPLLDPRLFLKPAFAAGTASILIQFMAFFGFIFVFLQFLQFGRGYSPLVAACAMLPLAFGLMPAARLAPKVVARAGRVRTCGSGLALLTCGFLLLSTVEIATTYWLVGLYLWLAGVGMGLAMTPATTAITDALPRSQQGVASAVNDLARELGGAIGIAAIGSILNTAYRAALSDSVLPPPLQEKAKESIAIAQQLGPQVAQAAKAAFTDGMHDAFLFGGCMLGLGTLLVVALLHRAKGADRVDAHDPAEATQLHDA